MLRRAAAATQELLQSRGRLCALLYLRATVAPMRRRRREGRLLSRQLTRDRCSSRVDGQLGRTGAAAAAAARGAGETGRARFHGGFVGSRAVRRRKGVSRRPREARGSRARRRRGCYALAEDRISKFCAPRAKRSSLDVCMRALRSFKSEFEDAGPRCVRNFPPAYFSLAILQLQNMPYPKYALMSSGAQDR